MKPLALFAIGALAMASSAAFAQPAPTTPWMRADSVVVADEMLGWTVEYEIRNPTVLGFYPDSFLLDLENRSTGQQRAPRMTTENMNALIATIRPVSGGDSVSLRFMAPAAFEDGVLRFRLYGHNAEGPLPVLTASTVARPGVFSASFPSRQVAAGAERVEIVPVPPADEQAAWPGVLLVHSEEGQARDLLPLAMTLRAKRFAVLIVSTPGCGGSTGRPDFAGPATMKAVETGLAELAKLPGVDRTRLGAWGVSQGATAVALLASRHPELRAVVLQSAYYDLWATHRAAQNTPLGAELVASAGRDSAAWRARSPLAHVSRLRSPVLILHGADDSESPVASVRDFTARMTSAKLPVTLRALNHKGHELSRMAVNPPAIQFLSDKLSSNPAGGSAVPRLPESR